MKRALEWLPEFPTFARLRASNLRALHDFLALRSTSSDFSVASLWSWDASDGFCLSRLNENLVIEFADYLTRKRFLSFVGDTAVAQTVATLVRYASERAGLCDALRLLPESVLAALTPEPTGVRVQPDRDAWDYLFELQPLAQLDEVTFKDHRRKVRLFEEGAGPTLQVAEWSLCEAAMQSGEFCELMVDGEGSAHEAGALRRMLASAEELSSLSDFVCVTVRAHGRLCAWSISELRPDGSALGHFAKALHPTSSPQLVPVDRHCLRGCSTFGLAQTFAILYGKHHVHRFNMAPDLGSAVLRHDKLSWRPSDFIRKYRVELATSNAHLTTRRPLVALGPCLCARATATSSGCTRCTPRP